MRHTHSILAKMAATAIAVFCLVLSRVAWADPDLGHLFLVLEGAVTFILVILPLTAVSILLGLHATRRTQGLKIASLTVSLLCAVAGTWALVGLAGDGGWKDLSLLVSADILLVAVSITGVLLACLLKSRPNRKQ